MSANILNSCHISFHLIIRLWLQHTFIITLLILQRYTFKTPKSHWFYHPTDTCSSSITCEHGGYQDPNNCGRCKCPDGLGGTYCQDVAPQEGSQPCSHYLNLDSGETKVINNAGYYDNNGYPNNLRCNWRIKVRIITLIRIISF